jgi:hypothetical protein
MNHKRWTWETTWKKEGLVPCTISHSHQLNIMVITLILIKTISMFCLSYMLHINNPATNMAALVAVFWIMTPCINISEDLAISVFTIQCHNPGDCNLNLHCCENIKFCMAPLLLRAGVAQSVQRLSCGLDK